MHESTHTVACMNDLALLHFSDPAQDFLKLMGLFRSFKDKERLRKEQLAMKPSVVGVPGVQDGYFRAQIYHQTLVMVDVNASHAIINQ